MAELTTIRAARTKRKYRPDQSAVLQKIETARKVAGLTVADLARTAGISERNYYNQMRDGCAWPRNVRALTMALRTLKKTDAEARFP